MFIERILKKKAHVMAVTNETNSTQLKILTVIITWSRHMVYYVAHT